MAWGERDVSGGSSTGTVSAEVSWHTGGPNPDSPALAPSGLRGSAGFGNAELSALYAAVLTVANVGELSKPSSGPGGRRFKSCLPDLTNRHRYWFCTCGPHSGPASAWLEPRGRKFKGSVSSTRLIVQSLRSYRKPGRSLHWGPSGFWRQGGDKFLRGSEPRYRSKTCEPRRAEERRVQTGLERRSLERHRRDRRLLRGQRAVPFRNTAVAFRVKRRGGPPRVHHQRQVGGGSTCFCGASRCQMDPSRFVAQPPAPSATTSVSIVTGFTGRGVCIEHGS